MPTRDYKQLEKSLGVSFLQRDLLVQSLVHRSYLNENRDFGYEHNERLEFLGDAVLELVVTEYLYLKYPNPEGELTNWRASLVNARMLSFIARELGVNDYLFLSKGESQVDNTKARQFILADALEAIIGALYLDQGYAVAKGFIEQKVLAHLDEILRKRLYVDPKSLFQEMAQEQQGVTPTYRVIKEAGPDHAKEFTIAIYLGNEEVATGHGSSKQEAQIDAAQAGLEAKGW